MTTESVAETGKGKLCEGFDPPRKKARALGVFFLSVVSHEADRGQALICGTDVAGFAPSFCGVVLLPPPPPFGWCCFLPLPFLVVLVFFLTVN